MRKCEYTTGTSASSSVQVLFCDPPPRFSVLRKLQRGVGRLLRGRTRNYLTAEECPALAKIWDNEEDAVYDDLTQASLEGLERWEAAHGLEGG